MMTIFKIVVSLVPVFDYAAYLSGNLCYVIFWHAVKKQPAAGSLHWNSSYEAQVK